MPGVYLDETNRRMAMNLGSNFGRLAQSLIRAGDTEAALATCDRCLEVLPDEKIPYDYFSLTIGEVYLEAGEEGKGLAIFNRSVDHLEEQMDFYFRFAGARAEAYDFDKRQNLALLQRIMQLAGRYELEQLEERSSGLFERYFDLSEF